MFSQKYRVLVERLLDQDAGQLAFWEQMAHVSYTLPYEVAQAVKLIAELEGRNVSEVASELLRTGCRNWGKH